jgi:sarcosine oxidase
MHRSDDGFHDAVVVGAGLNGLAAAWQLARLGAGRVALLERFRLGHRFGSSHGAARVTRTTYPSAVYANLMRAANAEAWPRLEREAGERLIHRHGGIFFGPAGGLYDGYARAMGAFPGEVVRLAPAEAAPRFPGFRFEGSAGVLWDRTAGVIAAERTLAGLARLCRRSGVEILEETRVTGIVPSAETVTVDTDRGPFLADRVVVTAGPWTAGLFPALAGRLTVKRQNVGFYRLGGDRAKTAPERFPVWAYLGRDEHDFYYGLPEFGREGVKAARHATASGAGDDPDGGREPSEDALVALDGFVRRLFTAPVEARIDAETCLYTNTPGEDFILDRHPADPRIVIGAGFSGHGFKFGPLTGRILAELSLHGRTTIEAFEADRRTFALS